MRRTADDVVSDWLAGHAEIDPYDEIGVLVAEVARLRGVSFALQSLRQPMPDPSATAAVWTAWIARDDTLKQAIRLIDDTTGGVA